MKARPITIQGKMVRVPIGPNGTHSNEHAELDLDSWNELQAKGFSFNFHKIGKYVTTYAPTKLFGGGNTVYVARIVAGAKDGEFVRCKDDNYLNLRKSNLEVIKARKPGKYRNTNYLVITD